MLPGLACERVAQVSLAAVRKGEQLCLVQSEQRALQRDREREIVRRQQDRVGKIHQIDDRDMFGQLQPVGTGDRNSRAFQRLDYRIEQASAPAHQHKNIAGPEWSPFGRPAGCLPVRDQRSDLAGHPFGKSCFRTGLGNRIERRAPALDVRAIVGLL